MGKMEGRLKVELRGIDRRLLNLAGSAGGIDFGTTTISSSNDIELTRAVPSSAPRAGSTQTMCN